MSTPRRIVATDAWSIKAITDKMTPEQIQRGLDNLDNTLRKLERQKVIRIDADMCIHGLEGGHKRKRQGPVIEEDESEDEDEEEDEESEAEEDEPRAEGEQDEEESGDESDQTVESDGDESDDEEPSSKRWATMNAPNVWSERAAECKPAGVKKEATAGD